VKYFTPDLYVQCNSPDADEADRALSEWQRANKRYLRHYAKIKSQLPESFRFFHDNCCLHDADLFGPTWMNKPESGRCKHVALVAQNINTLQPEYLNTHPFGLGQSIWLYDELNLVESGLYSHEIMVSDGRIIRLEFREFQLQITKLVEPSVLEVKRRLVSAARAKRASA
jgi:hypothetical protein